MTLKELESLQQGDVVVIIKIDEHLNNGTTSKEFYIGEEMIFTSSAEWIDFFRPSFKLISHFKQGICHYIERKIIIERENKLNKIL